MNDADLLRNRATRLFALAERARQQGHPEYADELTSLAREIVKHAVMIESQFRVQPPFKFGAPQPLVDDSTACSSHSHLIFRAV
jgi:hypothetical protein